MKKELAVCALVLGLGATAPSFAKEDKLAEKKQPVKMTEQQLDNVAGGQLIEVIAIDVVDVRTDRTLQNINIPVNAAVAVLGRAGAGQGVIFRPSNQ